MFIDKIGYFLTQKAKLAKKKSLDRLESEQKLIIVEHLKI